LQHSNQPSGPQRLRHGGGSAPDSPPTAPRLDTARLWAGGVMTAGVAGFTAVVAVLLVRGVLDIPLFAPERDGAMVDASTGLLAGGAALVALAATALLHVLILSAPQPIRFFTWIVALVTAALVLLPFRTSAAMDSKVGTAVVHLAVGAAIGSLLSAVARGATRRAP
jgi:ABC-type Fe3+-siderophore transport system permease subunit